MEIKTLQRNKFRIFRDSLSQDCVLDISKIIVKNITLWDKFKEAKNVMLFYPIKSEISLLGLLKDDTKSFYFPSVDCGSIFPVLYNKEQGFQKGDFVIMEPVGSKLSDFSVIDLILAPALAVDKNGYRLGYGKGFYDRFFEHVSPNVTKVVPVFSKLFVDSIPFESCDKAVDYVITEKKIYPTLHLISNNLDDLCP